MATNVDAQRSGLWIDCEQRGRRAVLWLHGDVDLGGGAELFDIVGVLARFGARDFVLDGAGVTFADLAGARTILALRWRAGLGGSVTLENPSPALRRLWSVAGFDQLMPFSVASRGRGHEIAIGAA